MANYSELSKAGSQVNASQLDTSEVQRFDIDDPTWLAHLKDEGYVVIANCLNEEEIETGKQKCFRWLTRVTSNVMSDSSKFFDPNNINTYQYMPYSMPTTGIIREFGAGHCDFSWFIRTRPKIKEAFGKIWDTDDLLSAFAGFNMFRPWQTFPEKKDWKTNGGWFHVDQHPDFSPGFQCVQGLVNLIDCTIETGGFTVVPGSHLNFEPYTRKMMANIKTYEADYIPIDLKLVECTTQPKLVSASAGDLVLWDSRTAHCSTPGVGYETPVSIEEPKFMRITKYVCMTPTAKATEEVLKKKLDAFEKHVSTAHWPHKYIPVSHIFNLEREDQTEVTEEMMRLIRGNNPIEGEQEIIERINAKQATEKPKNKEGDCIIN